MKEFSTEEVNFLRNSALLNHLSAENFNTFLELSQRVSFEAEEVLLEEGAHSDYLFIIISGEVELYKNDDKNESKYLIGTLSAGNSLGELRIIKNRPCSLTVITSQPTILLRIALSKFKAEEHRLFYESMLDSLTLILTDRLISGNQIIVSTIIEKKRKRQQLFITVGLVCVLSLLLCEVGLAYYYLAYPVDFCNQIQNNPSQDPR